MEIECRPYKPAHKPGRPNVLPLANMDPGDWFEAKLNWCRTYALVFLHHKQTGRRFILTRGPHRSAQYMGGITDSNAPPVLVRCERLDDRDGRRAIGDPKRKAQPAQVPAIDKKRAASNASIAALKAQRALKLAAIRHPDIFA